MNKKDYTNIFRVIKRYRLNKTVERREMAQQLSRNQANFHVVAIAIFYLISGVWELLIGATAMESTPSGIYFLLDAYRSYLAMLSAVTFFIGLLLLLRFNFARVLAIVLAWWNLFTIPIINIWWHVYSESIRNIIVKNLSMPEYFYIIILTLLILSLRIYIIHMLNISRAGYVFLKKPKNSTPGV